jgi:hypothetical protein
MGWPGKATPSENSNLHAEVTTIFLSNYISSSFRSTKKGVKATVNPALFRDTVVVLRSGIVVALL